MTIFATQDPAAQNHAATYKVMICIRSAGGYFNPQWANDSRWHRSKLLALCFDEAL